MRLKANILITTFLLLCFTLVGFQHDVKAEEQQEDVSIIYANLPDDWNNPHIWTWDDDGNSAFASLGWPGKEMVEDANNPGWYYLYIPSSMTNVIINANDATIQTDAISVTGVNTWITVSTTTEIVNDEEVITVTPTTNETQETTGTIPEYIPTKYVYAFVPVDWDTAGIWAWNFESGAGVFENWPGEEMELLDDGWFRSEIPDTADRVIINSYGDTETLVQTIDLTVGTEDVYILLNEDPNDDGKFEATLSDEKPLILGDTFTAYIDVPEDWSAPKIWVWSHPDGTNLYPNWPGEEIAYNSESGYYEVQLPTWVNRIIINNGLTNDEAAQTVDGEISDTTKDYIITVGDPDSEGKFSITITERSDIICDENQHIENGTCVDNEIEDDNDEVNDENQFESYYVFIIGIPVVLLAGFVLKSYVFKK